MNYPPHITYTMYDDAACRDIYQAVRSVFEGMGKVRITFDRIGYFDVSPLVLWASPQDCTALHQVHADIHARVDPLECRENYRPNN